MGCQWCLLGMNGMSMMSQWLVGGFSPPLWKMMEWKSLGMMKFPTEWKVIKFHGSKPPTRFRYFFGLCWNPEKFLVKSPCWTYFGDDPHSDFKSQLQSRVIKGWGRPRQAAAWHLYRGGAPAWCFSTSGDFKSTWKFSTVEMVVWYGFIWFNIW